MKYVYKKKALVLFAAMLDLAGGIIFFPAKLFRGKKCASPRKILVIRCDHIGDVAAAAGVLGPLRGAFPDAMIDFLVSPASSALFRNNPYVDNVVSFEAPWFARGRTGMIRGIKGFIRMVSIMRSGRYDLAFDLRGDLRHIAAMFISGITRRISYGITGGGFFLTDHVPYTGRMHEVDRNLVLLKAAGVKGSITDTRLYFSDEDKNAAARLIKECGIVAPYAVMHMVPGRDEKKWDVIKFSKIAEYLYNVKKVIPVIVGSRGDGDELVRSAHSGDIGLVDLAGKTSLGVLYCLLRGASVFIGVDSGPAHLAAAAGTNGIVIFSGANDPSQWAPRGDRMNVIYPGEGRPLSIVSVEDVIGEIDKVVHSS